MKPILSFDNYLKPMIAGILAMTLIFIVEIQTGALVGTVAYIFIFFYILWHSKVSQFPMILGGFATLFIITGFIFLFSQKEDYEAFIVNRILSVAIVWVAVYFTLRYKNLSAEEQIKNDQLQALFENAHEGIIFADIQGNIIRANPFLEKMFEYGPGEILSKNIAALIPDIVNEDQQIVGDRLEAGDYLAIDKDGNKFPVEINLSPFDNKGQPIIIVFILDATEKKEHEKLVEANINSIKNYNTQLEQEVRQRTKELENINRELKKSQYLYKAMAQNFPDGVIGVLDKDMNYLLVDGQDLMPRSLNGDSNLGRKQLDDIHSAALNYGEGALKKVYRGENISFDLELQDKVYNISSVPIPSAGEEINEILIVAKNVTDQKQLEKNLMENLEKEKELNLLKSRFVTTASHEFRTPLTTILSSAFLLEHYTGEKLENERNKHLGRIKRSVHNLTDLLNDFLSMGKLEEGKIRVVYDEINLGQFLEDLLQETELLKKDGQKIRLEYSDINEFVTTDKQLLRNILINLIGNSIKYSPADDTIIVSVKVEENSIYLSVTDHGIGIPHAEKKHIFDRFFRAKNAADIQGTGLGLNIVKKYVSLLNGSVDFESTPGRETVFSVRVPVCIEQIKTSA